MQLYYEVGVRGNPRPQVRRLITTSGRGWRSDTHEKVLDHVLSTLRKDGWHKHGDQSMTIWYDVYRVGDPSTGEVDAVLEQPMVQEGTRNEFVLADFI